MVLWDHPNLGNPLQEGYAISVTGKTSQKSTFGGSVRTRANDPLRSESVSMKFAFNGEQMEQFTDLYERGLRNGRYAVRMVLLTSQGLVPKNVLLSDGYGLDLKGNTHYVSLKGFLVSDEVDTPSVPFELAGIDPLGGVLVYSIHEYLRYE